MASQRIAFCCVECGEIGVLSSAHTWMNAAAAIAGRGEGGFMYKPVALYVSERLAVHGIENKSRASVCEGHGSC